MKNKEYFGKKIKFEEVLDGRVFINNKDNSNLLKEAKIYTNDLEKEFKFKIENKGNDSYKKLVFKKELGEGIIIGNCIKWEGKYHHSLDLEEEPSSLKKERCFKFFKVSTKMNEIVLIDKESKY